jgi:hypothetical protein
MTKAQLIAIRLARFPEEANSPDLELNAVAGHVKCRDGLYRDWAEYTIWIK